MFVRYLLAHAIAFVFFQASPATSADLHLSILGQQFKVDSNCVYEMDVGKYTDKDEKILLVRRNEVEGLCIIGYYDTKIYKDYKEYRLKTGVFDSSQIFIGKKSYPAYAIYSLVKTAKGRAFETVTFLDDRHLCIAYFRVDDMAYDAKNFKICKVKNQYEAFNIRFE